MHFHVFFTWKNLTFSSSRPEVFWKKVFYEMPQNSLENACVRVSFLINSLFSTLLKKRLWRRWLPVNFAKFIRTSFLQKTFGGCLWSLQSLLIFRGRKRCYRRNVGTLEKTILKTILSNFETCNIYSVDDLDLFNQALPQKTLNLKKMCLRQA